MLKHLAKNASENCSALSNIVSIDFNSLCDILMTNLPASIYFKDKNGHYIWCNSYQLKMAGLSKLEDIQGKTDYELPWYAMADEITNVDKEVLTIKKLIIRKEHANLFNGKKASFISKKIPWFKGKELIGIIGVSIELNKQMQEADEINLKSFKTIHCEMREPTLGLIHTLSILLEEMKDPPKKEMVQLALTYARRLMRSLNITLNSNSEKDQLSTYDKPKKNDIKSPSHKVSTQPLKKRPKILLVEDSPLAQRITESLLLDLDCHVKAVETAEQALTNLKTTTYDMIFIDLGLPGMNGIDLAKEIRQIEVEKNIPYTPIIGQSAQIDQKNKKVCINVGMQDLLTKPLTTHTLAKLLNNYVNYYIASHPKVKSPNQRKIHNKDVIDKLLFEKITNNNPKTAETFIHLTKQVLKTDVPMLTNIYKEKNWVQMHSVVHKLRGSFACIAAMRLEETFGHLEEYLCETKLPIVEEIKVLYNSALIEIERLKKEINF